MKNFVITFIVMGSICFFILKAEYDKEPGVDPRLTKYVNEWEADMQIYDIDYKRIFRTTIDTIVVVDELDALGNSNVQMQTIKIRKDALESEWLTRQAVYHELGHHVLFLDHDEDYTIMYEKNLGPDFYRDNWKELKLIYLNKAK